MIAGTSGFPLLTTTKVHSYMMISRDVDDDELARTRNGVGARCRAVVSELIRDTFVAEARLDKKFAVPFLHREENISHSRSRIRKARQLTCTRCNGRRACIAFRHSSHNSPSTMHSSQRKSPPLREHSAQVPSEPFPRPSCRRSSSRNCCSNGAQSLHFF